MKFPVAPAAVQPRIFCILILVLFTLVVYFNSLKGSFQFDDPNYIAANRVAGLQQFRENISFAAITVRPVLLFTFAVNNSLHQGGVLGFHLVNLALHVMVSVLIFHIVWRLQFYWRLKDDKNGAGGPSLALPMITALVFAVHPLNTDSVSYISSRSTVLATFFYLLTLNAFLSLFPARGGRVRGAVRWALAGFCLLGFYLGLAAKLIAASLPLMMGFWFLVLIARYRFPGLHHRLSNPAARPWLVAGLVGIFTTAWLAIPARYLVPPDQGIQLFGRIPYLLVQAKVAVFYYLKLFFFPINLNVDVGFPFSTFWEDLQIPLAMAAIAGILGYAVTRKSVVPFLAVFWFFLTLAPTSSFVPLNDLAVEHRTYLPLSLGLCLLTGFWILGLGRWVRGGVLVFLLLSFSGLTVARNQVWVDPYSLWNDAAVKNPHSPRTLNNLGKAHYERAEAQFARGNSMRALRERGLAMKRFEESIASLSPYARNHYNEYHLVRFLDQLALPHIKEQLGLKKTAGGGEDLSPVAGKSLTDLKLVADFSQPHYNLASVYLDTGRLDEAAREYQTAIRINPDYFDAYLGLGSVHNKAGRIDQAIESFQRAIEIRSRVTGEPDYALARLDLGEIYGKRGRYQDAIGEFKKAAQAAPTRDKALFNLGVAYTRTGDFDKAAESYRHCLRWNPRFFEARFNLAKLYQSRGQLETSTLQFEKLLQLHGPSAPANFNIAWNFQRQHQWNRAVEFYQYALAIDPRYVSARVNLAGTYVQLRKYDAALENLETAVRQQPESFQLHRQLGLLYLQTGQNPDKAREHLSLAAQLSPSEKESRELKQLIETLPSS